MTRTARIVGGGRAGSALASALADVGWTVTGVLGRRDDVRSSAVGVDLLVVAVPDGAVAEVAGRVDPVDSTVVAHLAGSLGLDALAPHRLRASLHPLVAIPPGPIGAERLVGAWYALAASGPDAERVAREALDALGGRRVQVADGDRVAYHAAACIASNHVVALLGQVERVAAAVGVPLGAYLDLVRASVDNVAELGPAGALTGPVARGDWATVAGHLAALDGAERPAYEALAVEARRLLEPGFAADGSLPWR